MTSSQPRLDVYSRVTAKIIADLEQGVRPWQRPWSADHAAEHITRPCRCRTSSAAFGRCGSPGGRAACAGRAWAGWSSERRVGGPGAAHYHRLAIRGPLPSGR